jgi:hypothetical protein
MQVNACRGSLTLSGSQSEAICLSFEGVKIPEAGMHVNCMGRSSKTPIIGAKDMHAFVLSLVITGFHWTYPLRIASSVLEAVFSRCGLRS